VAINTSALTLGSSIPAKSSFQGHSSGSSANPVSDEQNPTAEDSANTAGTAAASTLAANGSAGAQKSTGPSAQTRGNARSRTNSAAATGTQFTTDAQASAQTSSADFLSAMASALGRSATTAPEPAAPSRATAETDDSETGPSTSQQPAGTATDAVAWIAQVLLPATSGAQAPPGATAAAAPKGADDALGAVGTGARAAAAAAAANATTLSQLSDDPDSAAADPQASGFATQLAAQNAVAAGQSRSRANSNALPASQTAPVSEPQTSTTATPTPTSADNVNALADVQKFISGLTDATKSDADADLSVASPLPHPAATSGSADAGDAAAVLQAAGLTRSSSGLGNTTLTIHAPVGAAAFADEVTTQVTALAQSGVTQAQLQLNPADMGPVQVHITLQAGQASVWFGANHADTRAALEQSLPRLRELFAGAGMPLTDSGVFREPPRQQQTQPVPTTSAAASANADAATAPTVTQVSNIRLSLLDTYA